MNVFNHNTAPGRIWRVWTDFSEPITRRRYLTHGLGLVAVKYLGDLLLIYLATGGIWTPLNAVLRMPRLLSPWSVGTSLWWSGEPRPMWLVPVLLLWMLPFVALGLTLTMRRALDANRSPWISLAFLIPYLNYGIITVLLLVPSEGAMDTGGKPATPNDLPDASAQWRARTAGVVTAFLAVAVGVPLFQSYGAWLFVLTPFILGAVTAFVYNRGRQTAAPGTKTMVTVTTSVVAAACALTLLGLEGIICLAMALPIAIPIALLGGVVGMVAGQSRRAQRPPATFMLLALPLTAAIEPSTGHILHEVQSSIVINAPPEAIWPHVVSSGDIPEPRDWLFRAGIAYPIRSRIEGTGVGAVRYCDFSTGPFVEPITVWEPGRRLAFDVVESPPTMRELSPYRDLTPRHLHGYMRSKRGEFRFIDLGDGRTRLEGSSWYELEMAPEIYWQMFSDALVRRIHQRVLDHIKQEVESSASGSMPMRSPASR